MYIVGIDIAKRKHEAAVINEDGAVVIKPFSFTNNCSGYRAYFSIIGTVFARLSHTSPTDAATFVSMGFGGYTLHPSL